MKNNIDMKNRRIPVALLIVAMVIILVVVHPSSSAIYLLILFTAVILIPVFVAMAAKKPLGLTPDIFFATGLIFYSIFIPIDQIVFGVSGNELRQYDPTLMLLIIFALLSFYMGYYLSSSKSKYVYMTDLTFDENSLDYSKYYYIIFAVGLFVYIIFLSMEFSSVSQFIFMERNARRMALAGKGVFVAPFLMAEAAWVVIFAHSLHKFKTGKTNKGKRQILIPHAVYFVIYVLFQLMLGNRKEVLSILICVVVIYFILFMKSIIPLTLMGIGSVLTLHLYRYGRSSLFTDLSTSKAFFENFTGDKLRLTSGELGAAWEVTATVLRNIETTGLMFGKTYIDGIINLFPIWLYPDRPLTPSVLFSKKFHPDAYAKGGGMSFSFFAESILNFGIIGPILIAALLGILFRWYYSRFNSKPLTPLSLAIYSLIMPNMILLFRNDLSGSIKKLAIQVGTVMVPIIIYKILKYKSGVKNLEKSA